MRCSDKIQIRMKNEYKKLGIPAEKQDYWVLDVRTENLMGPYSDKGAEQLATQLNDFVDRNAGIKEPPFMILDSEGEMLAPQAQA